MCGIFGALGPLPAGVMEAASRALEHRGPDSEGRFSDGECALVHRRLKIIDLSPAAAQPMANEDGTVQVVFNGEIYNHHALRKSLPDHVFRSRSDTEVIVHGYEQWGPGVVERLDGMFALAIWDCSRKRLILARDRAGKKPLYYTESAGFRFGSTVESLGVPAEIALEHLPEYLAHGFVAAPRTLHRGVMQLAPGQRLVRERGVDTIDDYWQPNFGSTNTDSYEDATARVRRLVTEAIERRLESDVPLGAFLSGGIDSTIVVGVMARALGARVKTFSIGFAGDPRYDETRYARIAARAFDTEHTEFIVEPSAFELVETLVKHHDGPFGDSSAIPTWIVAKLTRQHVTVALTGDGGDELFCGYQRFLAAEAAERIPRRVRQIAAVAARALPRTRLERSLLGKARRFLDASALPLADRIARWNSFFFHPGELLRPELRGYTQEPLAWQREMFARSRATAPLHRVLEHNFRTYLPYDLLIKADRTSMAHGLETRSPFLDTALVEYASSLPPAYLRRGTQTKRILKQAFGDLLPSEILRRGKMGFGVPLGTWFRGNLRSYLHDHLGPGARLDAYLDRGAMTRLLDEHARGLADHGQRLWLLLTLEVWLRALAKGRMRRAA